MLALAVFQTSRENVWRFGAFLEISTLSNKQNSIKCLNSSISVQLPRVSSGELYEKIYRTVPVDRRKTKPCKTDTGSKNRFFVDPTCPRGIFFFTVLKFDFEKSFRKGVQSFLAPRTTPRRNRRNIMETRSSLDLRASFYARG